MLIGQGLGNVLGNDQLRTYDHQQGQQDRITPFNSEQQADIFQSSSPSISDYLPHDVKIQVLRQAPDVGTMLALMNACPTFMKAFDEAPRTVMTKVVTRQLGVNGFDIHNPLLELQHDLGYPTTLEWNNRVPVQTGFEMASKFPLGVNACLLDYTEYLNEKTGLKEHT